MDVDEAVRAGAAIFADMEAQARALKTQARALRPIYKALRDANAAGSLETEEAACAIDALATRFEADLFVEHVRMTDKAKARGIDLPQPRSGGGSR